MSIVSIFHSIFYSLCEGGAIGDDNSNDNSNGEGMYTFFNLLIYFMIDWLQNIWFHGKSELKRGLFFISKLKGILSLATIQSLAN